jgi:hypothetical protein
LEIGDKVGDFPKVLKVLGMGVDVLFDWGNEYRCIVCIE